MKPETKTTYKEKILRVLLYIQEHLDEPISLDDLASAAHLSPFHFHRIFRGMIGEGVKEHVRRLRLERAAHQLLATRWSVTRIAFEAGYETHESFTRAFRSMFLETPSEFRKKRSWNLRWKTPSEVPYVPGGRIDNFTPSDTGGRRMEVRIKKTPAGKVAFVRHVGPYPEVGKAWERLCAWAESKGLIRPDSVFLGLSYDDPDVTPPDKIRYDACIEISENIQPEGDIGIQELPPGEYAAAVHKGPFDGLRDFYARLCGEWAPSQGREIRSAPSIEVYLNDVDAVPPEEILTEVYIPLES